MVSPEHRSGTPEQSWWSGTTIKQQAGQIELEVEKQNVKHFSVETPFLAAVVKGTHFTVRVASRAASVSVNRGMVSVSDHRSGQSADITPGQRAAVSALGSQGLHVSGLGRMPDVQAGPPGPQRSAWRVQPASGNPQRPGAAPPTRHKSVQGRSEVEKGRRPVHASTIVVDDKMIPEPVRARRDGATKAGGKAATQRRER